MAEKTEIVISAVDQTGAAFASVKSGIDKFKSALQTIPGIGGLLGGLGVGTAVAGLASQLRGVIDLGDQMNDLSQKIGISVRDLGTWQLAASQSGTSLEAVAKGVKGLSTFMVENSTELKKAGITATDTNGALIQLADLFKVLPDGVEKTALAVKIFGKAGMEMIPLLNQGSAALKESAEKAAEYGKRMALLAPQADKFNDQMAEMAFHSKELGLSIADKLLPGLIGVATWMVDIRAGGERSGTAMEFLREKTEKYIALVPQLRAMAALLEKLPTAAALSGLGGDEGKRTSGGNISGGAGDLAAFDAAGARYMQERATKKTALDLLGKGDAAGAAGKVAKTKEPRTYYEGLSATEIMRQLHAEDDAITALRKKYTDLADPLQKYRVELDEINKARADGILTIDQAIAAEFAVDEAMQSQFDTMTKLGEAAKDVDSFAHDMGLTFSSAFEDAVIGGKKFSDVLVGLGKDIERIVLRKTITEPLGEAITSGIKDSGGGVGGVGKWIKSLFGFASGGSFTVGGGGGTDSQMVAFRATPGEQVTVSTPSQRGGGGITVNVIEDSSRAGQVQQRQASGGENILEVFVDRVRNAVAGDIARGNGPIPAAMSNTYGLNRAAGAY